MGYILGLYMDEELPKRDLERPRRCRKCESMSEAATMVQVREVWYHKECTPEARKPKPKRVSDGPSPI